jgi:peptidoglycan/LPS O-acetylase OafA/YrhL
MPSIYGYLFTLVVVTACFSLGAWRFLDEPPARAGRINAVDGMRGYLALSVMTHHALIARNWLVTGIWRWPDDEFIAQLGSVGVSLFFMITGFLFWGRLVARDGRPGWISLYIGRVFRIAPVYWLAIACMVLTVFFRSDFAWRQTPWQVAREVLRWSALGLLNGHDFNAYPDVGILLAGVYWTLRYEWRFYFVLLPASLVARGRRHFPAALVTFAGCLFVAASGGNQGWVFAALFGAGMTTASLHAIGWRPRLPQSLASAGALLVLGLLLAGNPRPYGAVQAFVLSMIFFLVCNGATFFGLLISRPAVRLGHISYGIYLLQGPVLTVGFDNALARPIVLGGAVPFWVATTLAALLLCCIASVVHAVLERPAIRAGKRCGARATAMLARPQLRRARAAAVDGK